METYEATIIVTPRQWVGRRDAHRAEYTFSGSRAYVEREAERCRAAGCGVRPTEPRLKIKGEGGG